jgi:uncharacterized phiE125 gp8 family phage protein
MNYKLVTAPTALAVSVSDMKSHLRVTVSTHDTLIQTYIEAATQMIENRTNLALCPQTWRLSLRWDEVVENVTISKFPILGFTSITYFDGDNVSQSFTNSQHDWISFVDGRPGSLIFPESLPTVYERDDAMRIQFIAGFSAIPDDLILAIKMLVWRMYNHPDDPVTERFSFVDKIVRDYRLWQL